MTLAETIATGALAVGCTLDDAQCAKLAHYTALVFKWQRISNLTGVSDAQEFATRHVPDCLAVLPYLRGSRLADIGSGAGLPGMVLACVRDDLEVFLIEPRAKRARFLETVRLELGLARVVVVPSRAEHWQPLTPPTTLIARAVGEIPRVLAAIAHLAVEGQRFIAMCGHAPDAAAVAPYSFSAFRVVPLTVPGWRVRHLAVLDRARDSL